MIQAALMGAGAVTGIVGGLFGGKKAKKAAKAQKKIARAIQEQAGIQAEAAGKQFGFEQEMQRVLQARANIQARRDQIEQTREARVRRAAIVASAAASGVDQRTTTIESGAGSIVSQFGANQGMFNIFGQAAGELTRLGGLSAEQQGIQLNAQGKINVLQGQGQVQQAKAQQGLATGDMISNVGGSLFSLGQQAFGGFNPTKTSSILGG